MIHRNRLMPFVLRSTEREVVTSTRRQPQFLVRPGSKLLQKRSALLVRPHRY